MRAWIIHNDVRKYFATFQGIAREKLLIALIKCGNLVADETRLYAPVDTGMLKASIASVVISVDRMEVVIEITAVNKQGRPYPLFQEYGWRTKDGTKIEGRFFLHGALANTQEECIRIIKKAIEDATSEVRDGSYFSYIIEGSEEALLL